MKKYKLEIAKRIETDSYEHGCDPSSVVDFGITETAYCKTIDCVIEELTSRLDCKRNELYIFDNRIEVSILENDNGYRANDNEIAKWKNNEHELFNATYSVYLTVVEEVELCNNDLTRLFPMIEQY